MINTNGLLYWDALYFLIQKSLAWFRWLKLVTKKPGFIIKLYANVWLNRSVRNQMVRDTTCFIPREWS